MYLIDTARDDVTLSLSLPLVDRTKGGGGVGWGGKGGRGGGVVIRVSGPSDCAMPIFVSTPPHTQSHVGGTCPLPTPLIIPNGPLPFPSP